MPKIKTRKSALKRFRKTVTGKFMRRKAFNGYVGRKRKKRDFRRLWITRINAASRMHGTNYSSLISKLKVSQISINRKMLAQMAVHDMDSFASLVKSL